VSLLNSVAELDELELVALNVSIIPPLVIVTTLAIKVALEPSIPLYSVGICSGVEELVIPSFLEQLLPPRNEHNTKLSSNIIIRKIALFIPYLEKLIPNIYIYSR
jgi:hypothetical protein